MRKDLESGRRLVEGLAEKTDQAYLLALRVIGSSALAEDAVQEAYTKLLENPPRDLGPEAALAYFLKAVRHTSIGLERSARSRRRREKARTMNEQLLPRTTQKLRQCAYG